MSNLCPQCGAPVSGNAAKCEYCGAALQQAAPPVQQVQQTQAQPGAYAAQPVNVVLPVKNKVAAGILAILLGGIGVHKFYLGQSGTGILYLLFCWTGIPAVVGLIEGIVILTMSDQAFMNKFRCQLG